jgi:hypothetical protein
MIRFVTSAHINKPPDIVDQAYVDLEKFEPIRGHIDEAGALAHLHFRKKDRAYIMEDELLETEPGKRYKSRVTGGGIIAEVETVFQSTDKGTLITLKWSGKGKAAPFNVLLYLLRGKIKRAATSELIEFKTLVETYGVKFS